MIRIAISSEAFEAIKASISGHFVAYPTERNGNGNLYLWLNESTINQLRHVRQPGETYSATIIRLAQEEKTSA